jgi:hypothetical protein
MANGEEILIGLTILIVLIFFFARGIKDMSLKVEAVKGKDGSIQYYRDSKGTQYKGDPRTSGRNYAIGSGLILALIGFGMYKGYKEDKKEYFYF